MNDSTTCNDDDDTTDDTTDVDSGDGDDADGDDDDGDVFPSTSTPTVEPPQNAAASPHWRCSRRGATARKKSRRFNGVVASLPGR
jgi:hypothetical protein